MYGAQNDPNQNNYNFQPDGTGYGVNMNSFGGQVVCFDGSNQNIPVATNIPLPIYLAAQGGTQHYSVWGSLIPASETFNYSSPTQPSFIDPGQPAAACASLPTDTGLQLQPINNAILEDIEMFSGTNFRLSKHQFEGKAAPMFQTSTFKNSHYNQSHYNNPNFQPEQWTPDCSEMETKDSIKPSRKRRGGKQAIKDGTMVSPCTHGEIRNCEDPRQEEPGDGEMDVDETGSSYT
jgi:hypothetical protein